MEERTNLNLKQLKVFYHVARQMNFTRAAAHLFITQSAVTKAIDSLEESLGVRLFVRERHRLTMTEAGLVLQNFADKIIRLACEAEEAVTALGVNPQGVLRLGTTKTFARYLMPPYMIRFHEAYPQVRIQMSEGTSREMVTGVLEGQVDVAIVGRVSYDEGVETFPFPDKPSDKLVVVMNPTHRLAGRLKVDITDLADEPLLLREKGSGMRGKVMELFEKRGIVPNIMLEAASIDFTKELIGKGAGIGILGTMSVEEDLKAGTFRAADLETENLTIPIDLVLPAEGYRPLSTRTFLAFITGGE